MDDNADKEGSLPEIILFLVRLQSAEDGRLIGCMYNSMYARKSNLKHVGNGEIPVDQIHGNQM